MSEVDDYMESIKMETTGCQIILTIRFTNSIGMNRTKFTKIQEVRRPKGSSSFR